MIDPDVGMQFLSFVEARHQAWTARQLGLSPPWTHDPIVKNHKFTNVFRVLDHGSQFLLRELISDPDMEPENVLMRCFLYRHTNRPEAWEAYRDETGGYPVLGHLNHLLEFWKDYRANGGQVFSGAYMIYPQSAIAGTDKAESIIWLTQRLFHVENLAQRFSAAATPREQFETLRIHKGVADFMSMQILTDWGYSEQCGIDRENLFVVPGPGARKGAAFLDPTAKAEDVIQWAREAMLSSPNCPRIEVHDDVFRFPSYMDAQNTLCEFSKYVRYASKPVPDRPYVPAHPGPQPAPLLPKHW